mgnify:CR=1 FL=1
MLSSVAAFIRTSLNHRRAVKEIIKLCNLLGLTHDKTKIWDELHNGNYNPIIAIPEDEHIFEDAFLRTPDRENRIWGYLHYMVKVGDIAAHDIQSRLENFTFFELLTDLIGPGHVETVAIKKPTEWWEE